VSALVADQPQSQVPGQLVHGLQGQAPILPEEPGQGRIAEIYGIYLPTPRERAEIFSIHLRLKKRDPGEFDLEAPVEATEGYTGADIKEVVTMGLKIAFHEGQELTTGHLLQAVPEIRPLSKTDPERVASMTEWLDRHTKAASGRLPGTGASASHTSRRQTDRGAIVLTLKVG
jgi:hypothetical protein